MLFVNKKLPYSASQKNIKTPLLILHEPVEAQASFLLDSQNVLKSRLIGHNDFNTDVLSPVIKRSEFEDNSFVGSDNLLVEKLWDNNKTITSTFKKIDKIKVCLKSNVLIHPKKFNCNSTQPYKTPIPIKVINQPILQKQPLQLIKPNLIKQKIQHNFRPNILPLNNNAIEIQKNTGNRLNPLGKNHNFTRVTTPRVKSMSIPFNNVVENTIINTKILDLKHSRSESSLITPNNSANKNITYGFNKMCTFWGNKTSGWFTYTNQHSDLLEALTRWKKFLKF